MSRNLLACCEADKVQFAGYVTNSVADKDLEVVNINGLLAFNKIVISAMSTN